MICNRMRRTIGDWAVFGRTVRGASHRCKGSERQDSFAIGQSEELESLFAVSVADGHGSPLCFRSGEGSRIAAVKSASLLARLPMTVCDKNGSLSLESDSWRQVPQLVHAMWQEEVSRCLEVYPLEPDLRASGLSDREKERLRENPFLAYGTTLVTVAVGENHLFCSQIGDGDLIAVSVDREIKRLLPVEDTGSPNVTSSMAMPSAPESFRVCLQPLSEFLPALILLCTDGYSGSFRDEQGFLKAGSDLMDVVAEEGIEYAASQLAGWVKETTDRGSGDDATVVLVCNQEVLKQLEPARRR